MRLAAATLVLAAAALATLAPGAAPARADGIHMPERAFAAPPAVPAQRALVVHRAGVETLVVESAIDADGLAFGWVLPVPAEPTRVERASRGALDALDHFTRPELVHASERDLRSRALLAVALLAAALWIRHAHERRGPGGLRRAVAEVLLVALLGSTYMASFRGSPGGARVAGSTTIAGIEARPTARVGAFDVTVLRADGPAALDRWLDANGFARVPAAGAPVVADLVREGWWFVCVSLARESGGASLPHPLAITFPAAAPVYPMRLTALGEGSTRVRLHVLANGRARAAGFDCGFAQTVGHGPRLDADSRQFARRLAAADDVEWVHALAGARRLGDPAVSRLAWHMAVLTRLEATLAPEDMRRDVLPSVAPGELVVASVHSPLGAWDRAARIALVPWALLLAVLVFLPPGPRPAGAWPLVRFLARVGIVTAAAGLLLLGLRASADTVPFVREADARGGVQGIAQAEHTLMLADPDASLDAAGRVRAAEARILGAGHVNQLTGRPMRGGGPGDVEVLDDARGTVVRMRTAEGVPLEFPWAVVRAERFARTLPPAGADAADEDAATVLRRRVEAALARGGFRNHFTGEPLRLGDGPGDLEIAAGPALRLRLRDGASADLAAPPGEP